MRIPLALVATAGLIAVGCGESLPPAPRQPIAFSHKVHAGDNKIGCTLCHAYALHSPIAGVPSMARCNGCHKFVARDQPEVKKVEDAVEANTAIPWVRVHRVPDHVFFTHERHINAGLKCQECHGPVETMDVVRQVAPLTMGWCLDCHKRHDAPRDCLTCHK